MKTLSVRRFTKISSLFVLALFFIVGGFFLLGQKVSAQGSGEFSLQLSPSPLVTTLKPGQTTEIELTVRNTGTGDENLKIDPRSFTFNDETGAVELSDTAPPEVKDWISFSNPTFTVKAGEAFTQKVRIALPDDTGFSYSFALIVSRQEAPQPTDGNRLIKASIAVFTLINVDRPGATRQLDVVELESDKKIYEYLPATISVRFKNTGNSIIQPYGNIFIQRDINDSTPITTLAVNENKGYILPGSMRTLSTTWSEGFPIIKTTADGKTEEEWDWSKIAQFRFGQYTAKLIGVYNDGGRDVPIEAELTFWVLPWKIMLGVFIVLLLVLFALWSIFRKIAKVIRRRQIPATTKEP